MFSLHFSTQNVNSLIRTKTLPGNERKQFSSPFLSLMKNSTEILFLSDTRLNTEKLKFLEDQFSLTEVIGVRRKRIFATSSEHCSRTGGVAILVPKTYDDILSVVHCEHDPSQIPRFLTVLAKLQGHCKIILSVFYGSPKSQTEKDQVWTRYLKHIESFICKFGDSPLILAGDTNEKLNSLSDSSSGVCTMSKNSFGKILNSFDLVDLYGGAERNHYKNDDIRMQRQNQIICDTKDFKTFFPKIVGCNALED